MAKKTYKVRRVNSLPSTGINGDQYLLRKPDDRFELYTVAPNGNFVFIKGITDDENNRLNQLNQLLLNKIKDLQSQEQLNERFNDVNSGIIGSINTTQTLPQLNALPDGIYEAENSGTYANGIEVEPGYYTKIKKQGTVWTVSSKVQLAESTQKLKNFETGKFYKANEVYLVNDASGEGEFRVKPTVAGGETSQWASDGASDWTRIGAKGREDTFNVDASNANLITFYSSIQDFYIVDSDDTAKAQDFLVNSVWVNNTTVNSQVGAFGLQIQRLGETPVNFGVSVQRTSEDLEIGKTFELRPVGGVANYKVYVKLKSIIPASTSFLQNHIGRIFNTSALQFKNTLNVRDLININPTVSDPKVYSSKAMSDWFKIVKNIWIYDPDYKKGDVYGTAYLWVNHETFGKFGFQLTKNGADNSNFSTRTVTPISGSTIKLELFNTSQPLKNISIVVEFNNFPVFPTSTGLITYTNTLFAENAFVRLNNRNIDNLLGITKDTPYKVNKITVTRNANDYLSIRETIMDITDASDGNRYEVYVPEGYWFELDIQLKSYVKLIISEKAVVECDSTKTDAKYVVPANYPYTSVIGQQINTVDYSLLHTIWIKNNSELEIKDGGVVSIIRGKYAIHIDSNTFKTFSTKGGTIKSSQALFPIGVGIWGGQTCIVEDCTLEAVDNNTYGAGIHNWNAQNSGSKFIFRRVHFKNCNYVKLDELGSGQIDTVELIDCTTTEDGLVAYSVTSADGVNSFPQPGGGTTNNPKSVPYNIVLKAGGTDIGGIKIGSTGWSIYPNQYTRDEKLLFDNILADGYLNTISSGSISKGDIVCISNKTTSAITVVKYTGDNSGVPFGIASHDSLNGEKLKVAVSGKLVDAVVSGFNASSIGTRKLTYSGGLVSNPTAKHYEVIAEAVEVGSEGFTKIKLL